MPKNIVIINGSPRKDGNTEILVDAFIEGAESSGNIVTQSGVMKKGELKGKSSLVEARNLGKSIQ